MNKTLLVTGILAGVILLLKALAAAREPRELALADTVTLRFVAYTNVQAVRHALFKVSNPSPISVRIYDEFQLRDKTGNAPAFYWGSNAVGRVLSSGKSAVISLPLPPSANVREAQIRYEEYQGVSGQIAARLKTLGVPLKAATPYIYSIVSDPVPPP